MEQQQLKKIHLSDWKVKGERKGGRGLKVECGATMRGPAMNDWEDVMDSYLPYYKSVGHQWEAMQRAFGDCFLEDQKV